MAQVSPVGQNHVATAEDAGEQKVNGLNGATLTDLDQSSVYFKRTTMPSAAFGVIETEDRRDVVSSHAGLGQLVSSVSTAGSFPPAPRLSHTPTSDFQPPYFPPPYNLPSQQTMDFHHPHFNTDSYSHLSSFHQGTQQYHQLHPADRNVLRPREDQIHMHTGLTAPHDVRRTDYGALRRPDVLVPGAHHLSFGEQDAAMLNIHPGTGLPIIDEANHQVS
ncbi:hypothetical protein KUTeg_016324 [Tegillarca granosa]|uniref:Uncharacterized protein n=1 Tax=Tegillarca granosa TaxID=220873 RepID=A0ABQ9EKJ2_TEGGR|nr:hypothetical protein KUTeg_016324 [Tegillarca granosa]